MAFMHWTAITITTMTYSWSCMAAAMASDGIPGYVSPTAVEINIGDGFEINCTTSSGDSSALSFVEQNTRTKRSSSETFILDSHTAKLKILNATEQMSGVYYCKNGLYVIGQTKVDVGTKPTNVSDFSCIDYDYSGVTCSFTPPLNKIFINYTLSYMRDRIIKTFPANCKPYTRKYECNVTEYKPTTDTYTFNLTGVNTLGHNTQIFKINHTKLVVPPKLDIKMKTAIITTNSITLSWKLPNFSHYREHFEYEIQLQPLGFNPYYYDIDYKQCNGNECNVTIANLKYPYHNYTLSVRAKVKTAENIDKMWSDSYSDTFRTKARPPDFAPETAVGSYYIEPTETNFTLYWRKFDDFEENGPNFEYIITAPSGNVIRTNQTSITCSWTSNQTSSFFINTQNSEGASLDSSHILVYHKRKSYAYYTPTEISKIYFNNVYTLKWEPPEIQEGLSNYTILWCPSKLELQNECKSATTIDYKYVNNNTTNFQIHSQEDKLNIAISANYEDYNTGLHWALCSADASTDLIQMKPVVKSKTKNSIHLRWDLDGICASIVEGYNISWCQIGTKICFQTTLAVNGTDIREYDVKGLEPFTDYSFEMLMYSKMKVGPLSDAMSTKTMEAAPSAPTKLEVDRSSITSSSANISWMPPVKANGIVKYYTVMYRKVKAEDYHTARINATYPYNASAPVHYHLTSLSSYCSYIINVTAHTVEDSDYSKNINISTLIGVPSIPRGVKVESNGNDNGILRWNDPQVPSGNVEFYVVAMIIDNIQKAETIQKYSLVSGYNCRFIIPDYKGQPFTYHLQVSAVNVAQNDEIDHKVPTTKILSSYQNDESICINYDPNAIPINDTFRKFPHNSANLKFHQSSWVNSTFYTLNGGHDEDTMYIPIIVICVAILLGMISYWLSKKYKKMKNIEAVLPAGLVDHLPNYKLGGTILSSGTDDCVISDNGIKKDASSHISRVLDCMEYTQKEDQHLLNFAANLNRSDSENSCDEPKIAYALNGGGASNEEPPSESSTDDSIELDEITVPTLLPMDSVTDDYLVYDLQTAAMEPSIKPAFNSGYVTPATLMLGNAKSNAVAVEASSKQQLQHQIDLQQLPNANGYLTSSLLKSLAPTTSPVPALEAQPTQQQVDISSSNYTKFDTNSIVPQNKLPNHILNIEQITPLTHEHDSIITTNNNNNNNNTNNSNVIVGYVTLQRLAEIGQFLMRE